MIDLNREEFEKLPEIAERLHTVFYNEDLNQYHAAMINSGLSVKYIQGAWYAYQEQQKKLDCCREENKAHLKKIEEALTYLRHTDFRECKESMLFNILKGNKDEN